MCSALQSSSEWSHLNPIRSGAARNTTPVKFSELNSPRMRRVIRIFLEVWLHNNYKRMRRLLDPAMMFFFTDISFHLLDILSPMVQQGFISFLGLWWTNIHFQVIALVCICREREMLANFGIFVANSLLQAYLMRWCTKTDKYGVSQDNSWMEQPDYLITMIPRYKIPPTQLLHWKRIVISG